MLIICTVKAEKTAETINLDGGSALAVAGDITRNEYIVNLVEKTVQFSGGKIHIIINNAGYAWDDPIDKIKDQQWGKSHFQPKILAFGTNISRHGYCPT